MALVNKRLGAAIIASIGSAGQRPDFYDAKIVDQPRTIIGANGRVQDVATVIYDATNLEGEHYLAERVHNLAFAFDRTERNERLDGPATQPKSWQQLVAERNEASRAFLMSRPEAADTMDLSMVSDEVAL